MNEIEPLLEEIGFQPHPDFDLDAPVLTLNGVTIRGLSWVTGYELHGRVNERDGLRDEMVLLPHSPTRDELYFGVYRLYRSLRPKGRLPPRLEYGAFLGFLRKTLRTPGLSVCVDHDLYRAALRHLQRHFDPVAPGLLRFRFEDGQLKILQRDAAVCVPGRGRWFGEVRVEGWMLDEIALCRHRAKRDIAIMWSQDDQRLVIGSRAIPATWCDTD